MNYSNLAEEGTYSGVCTDIGPDTSSKGSQMIDIVFEVSHIARSGEWDSLPKKFSRHVRIYLTDAAWPTSTRKLAALDFNGDFLAPAITQEPVSLVCEHEDYKGTMKERWEFAGWGESERVPPSSDELRKLTARYKTDQSANAKPQGAPPAPPVDDSDIPF